MAALRWDALLFSHARLVTHASFQYLSIDNVPQGWVSSVPDYDPRRCVMRTLMDGTSWYQGSLVKQTRRYVAQPIRRSKSMGSFGSAHPEIRRRPATCPISGMSSCPAGNPVPLIKTVGGEVKGLCQPASRRDRGCSGRLVLEPNDSAATSAAGVFLQDRWRLFKRLTLLPGVRLTTA